MPFLQPLFRREVQSKHFLFLPIFKYFTSVTEGHIASNNSSFTSYRNYFAAYVYAFESIASSLWDKHQCHCTGQVNEQYTRNVCRESGKTSVSPRPWNSRRATLQLCAQPLQLLVSPTQKVERLACESAQFDNQ